MSDLDPFGRISEHRTDGKVNMSVLVEKLLLEADAAIAAIEAEETQFESDWVKSVNGTYRNKSGALGVYYQKRVIVHLWDQLWALVSFAPDQPIRRISRNHLTID